MRFYCLIQAVDFTSIYLTAKLQNDRHFAPDLVALSSPRFASGYAVLLVPISRILATGLWRRRRVLHSLQDISHWYIISESWLSITTADPAPGLAPCDEIIHRVRVFFPSATMTRAWMPPMQQIIHQDSSLIRYPTFAGDLQAPVLVATLRRQLRRHCSCFTSDAGLSPVAGTVLYLM
jgi:hypothetical protein